MQQYEIIIVLASALALFVWGRWRYDIVSLLVLFACLALGLVPIDQAFLGFGHPATVTVAIVLMLSHSLTKSGAVEGIAGLIQPLARIPSLHVGALIFIAAFLSMFMNNVGALALLMPVAMQSTAAADRSPATVLMPLSFGSILGGLATMIGTPPNIIIATYRSEVIGEPFKMFDFTPVGGIVAAIGVLFIALLGWRLVKVRKKKMDGEPFGIDSYLFEAKITDESDLIAKTVKELEEILVEHNIVLTSLIQKKQHYVNPPKKHIFDKNDLLLLEGAQEDVDKFVSKYKLALLSADNARDAVLHSSETVVIEAVLPPGARLEGRTIEQARFKSNYGVNLLALSREDLPRRGRLRDLFLRAGDVLLLHGERERVDEAIASLGCYPLAPRQMGFRQRRYALLALAIFAVAVALSAFNVVPIHLSLGGAVLCMVLFRVVSAREMYDGVDWPVIVLLGAMIPVGGAMESAGATRLIADSLLVLTGTESTSLILVLLLVVTMTLSDILNNAATAILMAPIAVNIADSLQANPDPFLMAVAVGASCAFLTPIGHQNNALVMGPGGYRFGDYWRMGLPLEIIITATAIPLIQIVWPAY